MIDTLNNKKRLNDLAWFFSTERRTNRQTKVSVFNEKYNLNKGNSCNLSQDTWLQSAVHIYLRMVPRLSSCLGHA
jgi:hypothetical protein